MRLTAEPSILGSVFSAATDSTKPFSVTVSPLSDATTAPSVAEIPVIPVTGWEIANGEVVARGARTP
jgi:hypothetical protein